LVIQLHHLQSYCISFTIKEANGVATTMDKLKELLERTSASRMSPAEREEQRKSFAYGNTKFENDRITRETVERASQELASHAKTNR